jgi:hypothetical protein
VQPQQHGDERGHDHAGHAPERGRADAHRADEQVQTRAAHEQDRVAQRRHPRDPRRQQAADREPREQRQVVDDVDERIEQRAEARDLVRAPRDPAVQDVGQRRDQERDEREIEAALGQEQRRGWHEHDAQQRERGRQVQRRQRIVVGVAQQSDVQRDEHERQPDGERGAEEEIGREVAIAGDRHQRGDQERDREVHERHAPEGAHRARVRVHVPADRDRRPVHVAGHGRRREALAPQILQVFLDQHAASWVQSRRRIGRGPGRDKPRTARGADATRWRPARERGAGRPASRPGGRARS